MPQEIVLDLVPRGEILALEVTSISDLEAKGFVRPANPLLTTSQC
jgi:hypothetical protein